MKRDSSYEVIPSSVNQYKPKGPCEGKRCYIILGALFCVLMIIGGVIYSGWGHSVTDDEPIPIYLSELITKENLLEHLSELQTIAMRNNGNRAFNTLGYSQSIDYVKGKLPAYYKVSEQVFDVPGSIQADVPTLSLVSPITKNYVFGQHFQPLNWFEGLFDFEEPVVYVKNFGCLDSDYGSNFNNSVALILRGGDCSNTDKVWRAINFNASAALIFNDGTTPQRLGVFLGTLTNVSTIPVYSLSNSVGEVLSAVQDARVKITAFNTATTFQTKNLIAESADGNPESIIVVGSHLDSVPAGPGINDNGSGTSVNLEIAIQLYESGLYRLIKNKLRFAWWSAEEIGLRGSSNYVSTLMSEDPADFANIKMNINYDMIASPNFFRAIYNGANATDPNIRNGSGLIQATFEKFFQNQDLPFQFRALDGRSDYGPFMAQGIPAGGLSTGSDMIKTEAERLLYGGMVGIQMDPCYHLACDTVDNINWEIYMQMAQNAAYTLETFANLVNLAEHLDDGHF